jgi:predicted permease
MKGLLQARISTWFAAMRHRARFEGEMAEELEFHIESYAADLVAKGVEPAAAERQARLMFGTSNAAAEERCREAYGLRLWDDLVADVRYASRQFRHARAFTATVIIVLALGIGANATMFTVISHTLLRRLPYAHADGLMQLTGSDKTGVPAMSADDEGVLAWQKAKSVASLLYYQDGGGWLEFQRQVGQIQHPLVSSNFCDVLDTAPALGRCFAPREAGGTHGQSAILSDALWRSFFQADAQIIGRTVTFDRHPYTIVGVMPPHFEFPLRPREPQMWSPVSAVPSTKPEDQHYFEVMGRLQSGFTPQQAQEELTAIQLRIAQKEAAEVSLAIAEVQVRVTPFRETLARKERPALLAMLAAVLMLWLIACANVANLLLARGVGRQRELAVRAALGASRGRIVRQLLLEALLLSGAGAIAGLVLAETTLLAFAKMLPTRLQMPPHPLPDLRVLGALLGLSVVSALLFGLVPALLATRANAERSLRRQTAAPTGRIHVRLQHALVACEVGCTVVLLVICGLLLRTVFALRQVPLGFRVDHVALVHPTVQSIKYRDTDLMRVLYEPLLARIRAVHGVSTAALTTVAPLSKGFDVSLQMQVRLKESGPSTGRVEMRLHADSKDLQKVLGFSMKSGRFFGPQDTRESQPVAVVNSAFVKLWMAAAKSLDTFHWNLDKDGKRQLRIIGVMDDLRQIAVGEPASPEVDICAEQILPSDSFYPPVMQGHTEIALHTTEPLAQITPDILAAMASVDPTLKASVVETMQEVVNTNIGDQLFAARLLETFAGCALLVALTGLYGFLAYFVSQRTHEIGVRLALGAQRGSIQWMFLARALAMIGVGLAAGLVVSLFATRLVTRFLFGVRAHDATTLVLVMALMLVAGLLAAWLPARRASHVEPMEALREA